MGAILLDTNILVYVFEQRDPVRQSKVAQLLIELEKSGTGHLCSQCLGEFFNVTTRRLNPLLTRADAVTHVERWVRIFPVHPLTDLVILEAVRGARDFQLAYYDAQIWATARLNQIPLIFSEDFQDGMVVEGVRFVNPFAAEFQLEEELRA